MPSLATQPLRMFAYPPLFEKHHYVKIHMQVKIFEIRNAAGEKKNKNSILCFFSIKLSVSWYFKAGF